MKMMATAAEEIKEPPCHCPVVDTSPSLVFFTVRRKHNMKWKSRFIYLQCCEYRHTTTVTRHTPAPEDRDNNKTRCAGYR